MPQPEKRPPAKEPDPKPKPVREPPTKEPPREDPPARREPGQPPPVIQDPPAPDANPIDPRVFASRSASAVEPRHIHGRQVSSRDG